MVDNERAYVQGLKVGSAHEAYPGLVHSLSPPLLPQTLLVTYLNPLREANV